MTVGYLDRPQLGFLDEKNYDPMPSTIHSTVLGWYSRFYRYLGIPGHFYGYRSSSDHYQKNYLLIKIMQNLIMILDH
jgi:hypothetical protein